MTSFNAENGDGFGIDDSATSTDDPLASGDVARAGELSPFLVTEDASACSPPTEAKASLSFLHGLALVLGLQIGSGIFFAPSQVSNHVANPGTAVAVWLVAGILVWTGAVSFIELGVAHPLNGGMATYLRSSYGEFAGFLFSWTWVLIPKPCAMAMISMIFADNIVTASVGGNLQRDKVSLWVTKSIAIAGLWVISSINCLGSIAGAHVASGFLVLKLSAICSIAVTGIFVVLWQARDASKGWSLNWLGQDPDPQRQVMGTWAQAGEMVTAIYGALFCYGGWESLGFVAGEMVDPTRDLPKVIRTTMGIAVLSFMLVNVALFVSMPFTLVRQASAIAVEFGRTVFGNLGAVIYALVVSTSALGALNAGVFTTGRLCVVASKDRYFPRVISNGHAESKEKDALVTQRALRRVPRLLGSPIAAFAKRTEILRWEKQVPVYAILFSTALTSVYIVIGTFDSLVTFVGIAEYIFLWLSVVGLFRLRQSRSSLKCTYRTKTANPVVFCSFSGLIIIRGIITNPLQGIAIAVIALIGLLVFRRKAIG